MVLHSAGKVIASCIVSLRIHYMALRFVHQNRKNSIKNFSDYSHAA